MAELSEKAIHTWPDDKQREDWAKAERKNKPVVFMSHDEACYHANDEETRQWADDETPLAIRSKSAGAGIMASAMINEFDGLLYDLSAEEPADDEQATAGDVEPRSDGESSDDSDTDDGSSKHEEQRKNQRKEERKRNDTKEGKSNETKERNEDQRMDPSKHGAELIEIGKGMWWNGERMQRYMKKVFRLVENKYKWVRTMTTPLPCTNKGIATGAGDIPVRSRTKPPQNGSRRAQRQQNERGARRQAAGHARHHSKRETVPNGG